MNGGNGSLNGGCGSAGTSDSGALRHLYVAIILVNLERFKVIKMSLPDLGFKFFYFSNISS